MSGPIRSGTLSSCAQTWTSVCCGAQFAQPEYRERVTQRGRESEGGRGERESKGKGKRESERYSIRLCDKWFTIQLWRSALQYVAVCCGVVQCVVLQ